MATARKLDRLAGVIERASILDKPAGVAAGLLERILPRNQFREVASGTPLGHPLHAALVAIPIGSWTAASYLDLTGGDGRTARRLVGFGNLAAIPAALAGANDWLTTSGAERRIGFVHAALNDTALGLYGGSWVARRRGRRLRGAALAAAGAVALAGAGWLGGHLAYALGVGVDTTAFQHLPTEWTDAGAEADVPAHGAVGVDAAGVPVLLARAGGAIAAIADRCSHRGGPLHEGAFSDGCITCPWHGSRFAVDDGSVRNGPATRPHTTLQTRVVAGRVEVRRSNEPRALRSRPIGH